MKITLNQIGQDAYFEAKTDGGYVSQVHAPLEKGIEKKAPGPMETLLIAAAGCTSVDVLLILKKMKQPIEHLEIEIEGERQEINSAKPFRKIDFVYHITGNVDEKKANKAITFAIEKYCSVLESLHSDIKVNYKLEIKK